MAAWPPPDVVDALAALDRPDLPAVRWTSPEEWQNLRNSLALAIRLNEKLIAGSIDGQNVVTIRTEGLTTTLQFTLYVVPQALASKTGG